MKLVVILALAAVVHGSVADVATKNRAAEDTEASTIMEIDSSGVVEQLVNNATNITKCISCCSDEYLKLYSDWQAENTKGLATTAYADYGAWSLKTQTAFSACGAITTERSLYLRDIELFLGWGFVTSKITGAEFCAKACTPPLPGKPHVARALFAANIAMVAEEIVKSQSLVIKGQNQIAESATAPQKLSCTSGCFSAKKYMLWMGGQGTFCATSTTASINVCKTGYPQMSYKGTCSGMTVTPKNSQYYELASLKLSGGSGNCKAKDAITKLICQPGNKWVALLNNDISVEAEAGSTCLLEEFASNMEMSIDDVLDHNQHGPHAEELLVDCYRHAVREGVSLVEKSRQQAGHLKYQLEGQHEARAMALYALLPEKDKKHHELPEGTEITFA